MRRLQEVCFLLFIIILLGKTSKEEMVYLDIKDTKTDPYMSEESISIDDVRTSFPQTTSAPTVITTDTFTSEGTDFVELTMSFSETTPASLGFCNEEQLRYNEELTTFNKTEAGFRTNSLERCLNERYPKATRHCLYNGIWEDPIFVSSCNVTLKSLEETSITSEEERIEVANNLVILTSNLETLNFYTLSRAVNVLEKVTDTSELSQDVAFSCVTSISNLIQASPNALLRSNKAPTIFKVLEDISRTVFLNSDDAFEAVSQNMALIVIEPGLLDRSVGCSYTNMSLPKEAGLQSEQLNLFYNENSTPVVMTSFITLSMRPSYSNGRVSFQVFSEDNLFISNQTEAVDPVILNSNLIFAASVVDQDIKDVENLVTIGFSADSGIISPSLVYETQCVYWDDVRNVWSTEGGVTQNNSNANNEYTCTFNHLTNFATGLVSSTVDNTPFMDSIVNVIGLLISSGFLVFTFLIFLFVSSSRNDKLFRSSFLLINYVLVMLLLNILLIISKQYFVVTSNTGCLVVSIMLHYFVLALVAWAMIEVVNIYLAVFYNFYLKPNTTNASAVCLSSFWGWLMPVLFVAIVAAVDETVYIRNDLQCGVTSDWVMNLVVIPVGIMLGISLLFYVLVLTTFLGRSAVLLKFRNPNDLLSIALSFIVFLFLLGSILFGLVLPFATQGLEETFSYVFAVFVSLQGFFTFALYGVRQNVVISFITFCSSSAGSMKGEQSKDKEHGSNLNKRSVFETSSNKSERDSVLKTEESYASQTSSTSFHSKAYQAYKEDGESTNSNLSRRASNLSRTGTSFSSSSNFPGEQEEEQLHSSLFKNIKNNKSFKYKIKRPAVVTTVSPSSESDDSLDSSPFQITYF